MTPTVRTSERLARFMRAILPTEAEVEKAIRRSNRIITRLDRAMDVRKAIAVGSHWKETAVRRYSDFDLFIVFSREEARRWSPTFASLSLLGRVRRAIASSYPNTRLRLDKQAVTVSFEQGSHAVDVVPAVFAGMNRVHKAPVYLIPDGSGGWLETAPDLDKRLVDEAHERSGRKLRGLARMLKWWSSSRVATSPLSSLYLEWFTVAAAIPVGYSYSLALATIFETMARSGLPPLADPFEVSPKPLCATHTEVQRRAALKVAKECATRAADAVFAEDRGRYSTSNDRWSLVFNRSFPSSRGGV